MARTWFNPDQIHAVYSMVDSGQTLTNAPTTLEDELNYLRQQVRSITGESAWTTGPDVTLAQVAAGQGISNLPFSSTDSNFASDVLATTKRRIFPNISDDGIVTTLTVSNQSVDVTTELTGVTISTTSPTYNSGTRTWENLGAAVYIGTANDGNKGQVRSANGLDPVLASGGYEVYSRLTHANWTTQPTNITGVTVSYVSYAETLGDLAYTASGTLLAYNSGTAVNVGTNGYYKLVGASGPEDYIVVKVIAASLPGTNQTDNSAISHGSVKTVGFFYSNGSTEFPYDFGGTGLSRTVRYQQYVPGNSSMLEDSGRLIICNNTAVDVTETNNINQLAADAGVTLLGTGAGNLSYTGTNYLNAVTSLKAATIALDTQIASIGSGSTTAITNLQTFTGSTGNSDTSPNYTSVNYIADGQSLVTAISNLDSALNAHVADTTDAHDASAISFVNTTSGLTATDVQAALDEIDGNLDAHIADTTDAHDASAISITTAQATALGAASEDVAAALTALDTTIDTHIADSTDPHGSTLTQTNLTVTGTADFQGNVTLGNANTDTLTVNAAADFNDTLNVDGAFTTTGNVTLGNAAGDLLVINATLNANLAVANGVTIDGVDISVLKSDYDAHIADTTDAHDASAISFVNTTSGLTATDVQAAIDEVEGRLDTAETGLGNIRTFVGMDNAGDTTPDYSSVVYVTQNTSLETAIGALDAALNTHVTDSSDPHGSTLTQTNLTVNTTLTSPTLTATAALAISAGTSMTFDDQNLGSAIPLTNTATSLLSPTGGIVDALNEAFKGSVKQRGSGAGTGNATVNLATVCGITSYYSNYGGTGAGDTAEGFYMELYINGQLLVAGNGNDYREFSTAGTGKTSVTFLGKIPNANDVITAVVYRL